MMDSILTDFYVSTIPDTDGCSSLHRSQCVLSPEVHDRIFMGSFDSPVYAWQYFKIHHPETRAAFCLYCMKVSPVKPLQ